jgi:hypothetical protein
VVAHNTVHPGLSQTRTAEQVTAANDNADLDTQLDQLFNFLSHAIQNARVDTKTFTALQGFATEF